MLRFLIINHPNSKPMLTKLPLTSSLKFYQFDWLEPTSSKWEILNSFIKTNTNIIEEHSSDLYNFDKGRTNMHKLAEQYVNSSHEFEFLGEAVNPICQYISYKYLNNISPLFYYRFYSTNELIDRIFNHKSNAELYEKSIFPTFYNDSIPIFWFTIENLCIALNETQRDEFIRYGFDLEFKEDQSFPTKPIENFDESAGIKITIEVLMKFGNQKQKFEQLHCSNQYLMPNSGTQIEVTSLFYALLFLQYLYKEPEYTIIYPENTATDFCDIIIQKNEISFQKIQVKSVTSYSKIRRVKLSNSVDNCDFVMFVSLDINYFIDSLWFIDTNALKNRKQLIVPGYYLDNSIPEFIFRKGSKIFDSYQNRYIEFRNLLINKYKIENMYVTDEIGTTPYD